MSVVFIERADRWTSEALDLDEITLGDDGIGGASDDPARVMLVRCAPRSGATSDEWCLVVPAGVAAAVNGEPCTAGIRVLADRDEIRGPWGVAYLSTERLACIEPIPASMSGRKCPRSHTALVAGTPGVQCPACGLWFCQSDDLPCWTYASACVCGAPTALDGGRRFDPEVL